MGVEGNLIKVETRNPSGIGYLDWEQSPWGDAG